MAQPMVGQNSLEFHRLYGDGGGTQEGEERGRHVARRREAFTVLGVVKLPSQSNCTISIYTIRAFFREFTRELYKERTSIATPRNCP
jgi:hypothetical protein